MTNAGRPPSEDTRRFACSVAVAVGFEPTEGVNPHTLSRRAPSAARTRYRRRVYGSPVTHRPAARVPGQPVGDGRRVLVRTSTDRARMRRMSPFPVRRPLAPAALAAAVLVVALAGCAPAPAPPPAPAAPSCPAGGLPTLTAGTLTVGTDQPVYPPWYVDDDPTNGQGFESAVAYAVAENLGYAKDKVSWARVP